MAKNMRQETGRLQFTASAVLVSGQGFLLRDSFGVIGDDAAIGDLAVLDLNPGHVYELPCNSGDVIAVGDSLFWDDGADELTLTATGNFYAGKAFTTATGGVVLVELMLLNGNAVVG